MRRLILPTFFLMQVLSYSALGASGSGLVSILARPNDSSTVGLSQFNASINRISRQPWVFEITPVFTVSERKSLIELGGSQIASTRKITIHSKDEARRLSQWVASAHLGGIQLESNWSAHLSQAEPSSKWDPLEKLQWGLHNDGDSQRTPFDDWASIFIPGVKGEDVHLENTQPEKMDPEHRVIVAILDTGIDYNHPDLKNQILTQPEECKAADLYKSCMIKASTDEENKACDEKYLKDTDGNGYPLDCSGWNVTTEVYKTPDVKGDGDASDKKGHGTHIAGIIGAAVNGVGIRGVAQNIAILPIKVITAAPNAPIRPQSVNNRNDPNDGYAPEGPLPNEHEHQPGSTFVDTLARGILYAVRTKDALNQKGKFSKFGVINMSLAWTQSAEMSSTLTGTPEAPSTLMRDMVKLAQDHGFVVVSSAGNDSTEGTVLPCRYPGVICVAAHGPDGGLSHFSNFGASVDIAAPGLRILSTWPTDRISDTFTAVHGYEVKNGTSMAAPFVTGAVAKFLNAGFSPEETYSRLLLGARPHRPASFRNPTIPEKFTRSGNMDLAASFRVKPQPLIIPQSKDAIRLAWDRKLSTLSFEFTLNNTWMTAGQTLISAKLLTSSAHLQNSSYSVSSWPAKTQHSFPARIVIDDPDLDGRVLLEITSKSDGFTEHKTWMPIEINVLITPQFRDPELQVVPIHGALAKDAAIKSVNAMTQSERQEFIAIGSSPSSKNEISIQLLTPIGGPTFLRPSAYDVKATERIASPKGDLFMIQRLKLTSDPEAEDNYAFIYLAASGSKAKPPNFRFDLYDHQLKFQKSLVIDQITVSLSDRFQWMTLTGKGKTPAWLGKGLIPELEEPAFNPWKVDHGAPTPQLRLYYLASDGIRTVNPPQDQSFIQILTPSEAQKTRGEVPVILGQGDAYRLDYFTAVIRNAEVTDVTPLDLKHFRGLWGVDNLQKIVSEILPLRHQSESLGTAISGAGSRGSQRTTWLMPQGGIFMNQDTAEKPINLLDTVKQISGVFFAPVSGKSYAFAETHYELQFHDFATGQSTATSLNRFSYIPSFVLSRPTFPVVLQDRAHPTEDWIPGAILPAGLNDNVNSEVIFPRYNENGKLLNLTRPARLRFEDGQGCDALPNTLAANSEQPTRMIFYCGDRFLILPLTK